MARTSGLRTEILTTITLLMGAALLLGGVLMLRLTEQSLLEQKTSQLRLTTTLIAQSLAGKPLVAGNADAYDLNKLKQLPEELQFNGWWLYDRDLSLLASFSSDGVSSFTPSRRQQVRLSGQPFEEIEFPSLLGIFSQTYAFAHFIQPIYHKGHFAGLLAINYSLDDIRYRLLLSQRLILIYVLLYGSVLVAVGYYLLQRNVIKPAQNLLQATEDVSRGDLETRLPVAGPLEISRLADAYNHMVNALSDSRQETRNHIATLEQTNQELHRTKDELIRSEKLASVGQLAAGLAHELGNPLAAVIGYLEILKGRVQDENVEIASCALSEAERIDYLVRELLNFSRPTEVEPELLDPVKVLRSVVVLLDNQGVFSRLKLIDQLPETLGTARIINHKIQQLFVNLLLNAAQASPEGQIRLSAGQSDGMLWIKINDDGCGIAPDHLSKIFDPFFTTKEPGEGTGLGLSICHRIVEEANGCLSVASKIEEGSCFKVEFPFV